MAERFYIGPVMLQTALAILDDKFTGYVYIDGYLYCATPELEDVIFRILQNTGVIAEEVEVKEDVESGK